MAPAIRVARHGFRVTEDLVSYMAAATAGSVDFLTTDPTWAIDFAPNGTRLALNDTMTRKRYADTLEAIALKGADAFYKGAIANATITALRRANGTMTLEDLRNYTVALRKPTQIEYRGFKLTSGSAPSSGGVALSVMKTVEGYERFGDPALVNLSTHRLDEAIRFGYGEVGIRLLVSFHLFLSPFLFSFLLFSSLLFPLLFPLLFSLLKAPVFWLD
jgi:gamma-glutamyltranspeptidase/glutathione hydrolase